MLSLNRIKFIRSLLAKKTRSDEKLFIVEGVKLVEELLLSSYKIHSIYAIQAWVEANQQLLIKLNINYAVITPNELERIAQLTTPNQVLALVHQPETVLNLNTLQGKMVLGLDNVADPGNLGTIIRIADWFGIDTIVCSPNTVEHYNTKVVQASMGSFFRVNVFYTALGQFIAEYKEQTTHPVYAAALGGKNVYNTDTKAPCLLVMGSESHGISKELEGLATGIVTIPAFEGSKAESLNVAVSTAIICGEIRRKG